MREYLDETIALEMPHLGEYVRSYAEADRAVEVHVFRGSGGELVAFVTKSPGMPQRFAELVAESALKLERSRSGSGSSRVVFDPHSLPRSGSS